MTNDGPGHGWCGQAAYPAWYDLELPLRDALDDPELDPIRRALAVLGMGTELDTGHFAAAELLEAVNRLAADCEGEGREEQDGVAPFPCGILNVSNCDFRRALWYAGSRCEARAVIGHLGWLTTLMRGRAGMFRAIRDAGGPMPLLPGVQSLES